MSEKHNVAAKLRQFREARDLSAEDLAERCQINKKFIELLEAGEMVASMAPILRIARGLEVKLSALIDDAPSSDPVVVRGGRSETAVEFSGLGGACVSTLDFHPLAKNKKDRHMEPFVIDLYPSVPEECTLSYHDGEEFIYVLAGELEVLYGEDRHLLKPGDSIYYESTTPHQVQAVGEVPARILAVVYA